MKVVFFIALLFICFVSCKEDQTELKPSVFLEKEEMVDVLVDVQMLEAHYHNKYQRPNVYANALDSATYIVLKRHNITKKIFKDNLIFYAQIPDTLFVLYEIALDTINNRINSKSIN